MNTFVFSLCGFLFCLTAITSCSTKTTPAEKITVNQLYIDSLKKLADTSYTKKQFTANFALAEYYGITKDGVLLQIMKRKDSAIKQVIVAKSGKRIYFAQYYDNGQLKGLYNFDNYGSNSGASKEYYENGHVKEAGEYKAGFRTGEWTMFDSTGKPVEKVAYDANGQQLSGGH